MSAISVDISDFVSVDVNISPLAIPYENFGLPLVIGDSGVIDTLQRVRLYSNITGVGQDFGSTAPEYLAAEVFFSQQPQPASLMIGSWARTALAGLLVGATLTPTPTQQLLANFTAVTTGSLHIDVDGGTAADITGVDLSGALNLNGVAALVQTAIDTHFAGVSCSWDAVNQRFVIESATTGALSSVSFATTAATGVDISALMGLQALNGGYLVPGIAAEPPLAALTACANVSTQWYGASFAASVMPADADHEACAAYILASSRTRLYGLTIQNTACLQSAITNDLASALQAANNKRVFWMYSSSNPYAHMTMFGRAFTVDFSAPDSTITLAYKQAPGIAGENLTESQFAALLAKSGNVVINVNNGATFIWQGKMANGYSFDEVHNVDWQTNRIQDDLFNLLYQTTTKVPQTDPGNHQLATQIESSLAAGVNNGMSAPGVWNASGFGMLQTGTMLSKGFYVYAPSIASQSQADREARKSVTFQIAQKLAGAVERPFVVYNVNR